MSFLHGKGGSAKVGSTSLKVLSWAVDDAVDLEDSSNTTSGGHKERTAGLDGIQFTLEAQWDATVGPYDSPPALVPGTIISSLSLFVAGTSNNAYVMSSAMIEKSSVKMAVKNVITYTVTGYSQGAFTRPTTA